MSKIGDGITVWYSPAELMRAVKQAAEQARAEGRREGFVAARKTKEDGDLGDIWGNPLVSPVFESVEDYEKSIKEGHETK